MQRLEVSGAVRLIYRSLGVKGLNAFVCSAVVGRVCQCKISAKYGRSVTTALSVHTHGTTRLPMARFSRNIARPEGFCNNPSANSSLVTARGKQQALYIKTYSSRLKRRALLRMWVDAHAQDFVANDELLLPILKAFVLRLLKA